MLSGGIASFALLFALVSGNALYSQPGRHPRPIMATRPSASDAAASAAIAAKTNQAGLMAVPLVLEVQTALSASGHYTAELDGKPGQATAAAIRAFQSEHGLRVDGEASPRLLAEVKKLEAAASSAAHDPASGERYASITDAIESASLSPDAAPTMTVTSERTDVDADVVRRIQSGLAAAAVADLTPDGIAGEATRAAIRTFEALEGLDVTGEPDERILKRLIEIGALD